MVINHARNRWRVGQTAPSAVSGGAWPRVDCLMRFHRAAPSAAHGQDNGAPVIRAPRKHCRARVHGGFSFRRP